MSKDSIITLKVEKEMVEKLKEMAAKDRRNMSSYIRMILDKVISGEIKP